MPGASFFSQKFPENFSKTFDSYNRIMGENMKLNKNDLRKLILQEMRLLKEAKEMPTAGELAAVIQREVESKGFIFVVHQNKTKPDGNRYMELGIVGPSTGVDDRPDMIHITIDADFKAP